jgi:glycosyltransferase involved in cell wall biosynthesis
VESFRERGVPASRLRVNPYGVDLARFRPQRAASCSEYDLIFVGVWSLQKGVDTLSAAMAVGHSWRLLHVGASGDAPLPASIRIRSVGRVDQTVLPSMYAKAKVFVLPSRQEGLALVLLQALACGLVVVATERTGASDLRAFVAHEEAIVVVPPDDPAALANGIRRALEVAEHLAGADLLGESGRAELSWHAYARRYEAMLREIQACM